MIQLLCIRTAETSTSRQLNEYTEVLNAEEEMLVVSNRCGYCLLGVDLHS